LVQSLGRQTWLGSEGRRLRVVIVLNNCTDNSKGAFMSAVARFPNLVADLVDTDLPPASAHVGWARRLAMERAYAARPHPLRSVLLTTDADAVPEPSWIEANLQAIKLGADLVGGLIIGDEAEEAVLGMGFRRRAAHQLHYARLADRLATLIEPSAYDPWPRHSDHTGASLAVRADVYAAVGGIPALPFREDLAFVSRVKGAGYRVRHSLDVRVRVSARLEGRARGGMADCIRGWMRAEESGLPHLVEAPIAIAARLAKRRMCHDLARAAPREFNRLARELGFAPRDRLVPGGISIPSLIERIAPDEPDAPSSVPVEAAIGQIGKMITDRESQIRAL
jgi:hypothetical protein